jgi:DNA modification methylase
MARAKCKSGRFEVVVGNVGTVYEGKDCKEAREIYKDYCKISKKRHGRAGGEPVTLFRNGEIEKEHYGDEIED